MLDLTFNGHACVTLSDGERTVVCDPYRSGALGGRIRHAPVHAAADIVTVSHYHVDHSHVTSALGAPQVVDRSGTCRGIDFTVRPTYHDRCGGTRMGMTSMIAFPLGGLRIVHLGDIGCDLTDEDVRLLGPVDVLLWPVGDVYTLGPADAPGVLEALAPQVAIPLHFDNARCELGMQPIEALLPHLDAAGLTWTRAGQSTWSAADGLPQAPTVAVLEPAL